MTPLAKAAVEAAIATINALNFSCLVMLFPHQKFIMC